jgi:hypothetical protein
MNAAIESTLNQDKIYLPISDKYVDHWGFWEAAREILQNAIDTKNFSVGKMESSGVLKVKSLAGAMDLSTLMLGESSKRDDENSIGKYGEGYKLALLVLSRLGYNVLIKNGFDCWRVSIDIHPQLNVNCLTIDVFKDTYIDDGDENEVSFVVTGVKPEDFEIIDQNYLGDIDCLDPDYIEVIAENNGSHCLCVDGMYDNNKVFVGGLYVCDLGDGYKYSYNFAPNILDLDRDRKSVSEFYLQREVTKLLAESGNIELLIEMASNNYKDVSDYYSVKELTNVCGSYSDGYDEKTVKIAVDAFKSKNGEKAYPISEDTDFSKTKLIREQCVSIGLIPVTVKKVLFDIIKGEFKDDLKIEKLKGKISDNLTDFIKLNRNKMQPIAIKRLKAMVKSIKLQGE